MKIKSPLVLLLSFATVGSVTPTSFHASLAILKQKKPYLFEKNNARQNKATNTLKLWINGAAGVYATYTVARDYYEIYYCDKKLPTNFIMKLATKINIVNTATKHGYFGVHLLATLTKALAVKTVAHALLFCFEGTLFDFMSLSNH